MTPRRRLALILLVLLSTVGCDQATKVVAQAHLPELGTLSFFGDIFLLHYAENKGAFLGLGSTLPDAVRGGLFMVATGLLLGALLIWLFRSRRMGRWNTFAVALLCGGGIGNLIDRILRDGIVVDFLNLGIGSLRTGIFNVADMAITAGIVMLFFGGARRQVSDKSGDSEGSVAPV
jgi:signal peptidase II